MATEATNVRARWRAPAFFLACSLVFGVAARSAPEAAPTPVGAVALLLEIDGPLGPAVAEYVARGIEEAPGRDAALVILRLDTPGGLESSMRRVVQAVLGSSVPVAAFVAPEGARAASAGTYILLAAHVAAMAPATNLGAATPVRIVAPADLPPRGPAGASEGGEEGGGAPRVPPPTDASGRKAVEDAAAYLRGLAELRGRNADWADRAVREGVSLTAEAALEDGVVDLVVPDVPALLAALDGRQVEVFGEARTLATRDLPVEARPPGWLTRLLATLTDPNVAYLLLLLGIYGLFFELSSPGGVVPGVLGGVSMLMALYAFQVLPVNHAGVALILLGLVFMVGEVFVVGFGALGIGGTAAFVIGSLILVETDAAASRVSPWLIGGLALVSVAFFMGVTAMAVRHQARPPVSGPEAMVGAAGEAEEDFLGQGWVRVAGERWRAESAAPLTAGQRIRVRVVRGLTLDVDPWTEEG